MSILPALSSNVPAAAAMIAAAIAAAYASLKYFSDKAAKVTEFRKAWIESLRQAVSEFSGSTHTIAGRIAIRIVADTQRRTRAAGRLPGLGSLVASSQISLEGTSPVEKELATELLTHWSTLRLSYNKIILHMNPAEHDAYSRAERSVADYTSKLYRRDVKVREAVSQYLEWCIDIARLTADHSAEEQQRPFYLKIRSPHKYFPIFRHYLKIRSPYRYFPIFDKEKFVDIPQFHEAQMKFCAVGIDVGSALLLSTFATRQLLHGDYKDVAKNVGRIEQGIRVVDTLAAMEIKRVWEHIKRGEPEYRLISWIAIASSILLIVYFVISLASAPSSSRNSAAITISCTSKTVSPSMPIAGTAISVIPQILECKSNITQQ